MRAYIKNVLNIKGVREDSVKNILFILVSDTVFKFQLLIFG